MKEEKTTLARSLAFFGVCDQSVMNIFKVMLALSRKNKLATTGATRLSRVNYLIQQRRVVQVPIGGEYSPPDQATFHICHTFCPLLKVAPLATN